MPATETMAVLRRAIASSLTVRLGYGEGEGLVDPMRLQAGMLTAVDRVTGEVRTFAVSRIVAAEIPDHVTAHVLPTGGGSAKVLMTSDSSKVPSCASVASACNRTNAWPASASLCGWSGLREGRALMPCTVPEPFRAQL